jgi:hypothetical protein
VDADDTIRPISGKGNTWGPVGVDSSRASGEWYRNSVACTAGDLLMDNGAGLCRPYDISVAVAHLPVGICLFSRDINLVTEVITSGHCQIKVASGVSVTAGSLLKPDPVNIGGVVNASSLSDGPIIGTALENKTGAGVVRTLLSLNQAGSRGDSLTALTYGATVNTNAAAGSKFKITATNGTAFTIANPTNPVAGMELVYTILNSSGGAMGAVTWGAAFKLDATGFVNPANTKQKTIRFMYDGTNWIQVGATSADI